MVHKKILADRGQWLAERKKRIGGSEAASIIGMNPYMTNVDLWKIKTGQEIRPETENESVIYGRSAEPLIRELFRLDHPELNVFYEENNLFVNDMLPFAHASLDGWTENPEGIGVIEFKTATISSPAQKTKWNDRIPDNYFCQILHYMAVTEADFAILRARLRWMKETDIFIIEKEYRFDRSDVEDDIHYLVEKETEFNRYIREGKEPPLILPEI